MSKDSSKNCYILVVIDCFTRFVELYPIGDTSAAPCARALLSHVCRYGTPMTIRSDRGTQFVNAIISQLLSLLQIEHELSLAYSKEHNAIVERANKEVMRHLTAIIFDKQVNAAWSSEYLPLVQRIMNAEAHDTIGVSPAELLFGKAINLYTGLLSPFPPESLFEGQEEAMSGRLSDHVAKLNKMQSLLVEVARDKQLGTDLFYMYLT
jgi:transposase InsO family protein